MDILKILSLKDMVKITIVTLASIFLGYAGIIYTVLFFQKILY